MVVKRMKANNVPTPLAPLGVSVRYIPWRGHQIALHEAGTGPTVLLIHSINASASCYEMRKPFADLQRDYHVVAIDLLGYGDSDRPDMLYSAELYAELLADVFLAMSRGQNSEHVQVLLHLSTTYFV